MGGKSERDFWEPQKTQIKVARRHSKYAIKKLSQVLIKRALILTVIAWIFILWLALRVLEFDPNLSPLRPADWTTRNDATALRDYFWAWSFPLGALLVSLTLVNALRRTRIFDEEKSIKETQVESERFQSAAELLASNSPVTRISGINALESLMAGSVRATKKDGPERIWNQALKTLTVFYKMRSHEFIKNLKENPEHKETISFSHFERAAPIEIEISIISIIKSISFAERNELLIDRVDLSGGYLERIALHEKSDLGRINFVGTNFANAFLPMCKFGPDSLLMYCNFSGAYLRGSTFINCTLDEADFSNADLMGVNFIECSYKAGSPPKFDDPSIIDTIRAT